MRGIRPFRPLVPIAIVLALGGCDAIKSRLPWRLYRMESHSMEPTLPKGISVVGVQIDPADLNRGDVVFVRARGETYVSRVAALPGDTIALVNGQVVLDGTLVDQHPDGQWDLTADDGSPAHEAPMFDERFAGEAVSHRIIDDIPGSLGDNFGPITLKTGEFFVLGDNRDHAADSRFPSDQFGLGVITADRIERRLKPD